MTGGSVLVTGAGGPLGRLVVRSLRGSDRRVIPVARSSSAGELGVDLTRTADVRALFDRESPETLIHLAVERGGERLRDRNAVLNENVFAAAESAGIPSIVFASSGAVYGTRAKGARVETDPLDLASDYAAAKHDAEVSLRALAERRPLVGAVALRIFNVVGPSFEQSLVTRLARSTPAAPVELFGLDGYVRDYVHERDVVAAIAAAAFDGAAGFRVANIGSGIPLSNRELCARLESSMPIHYRVVEDREDSNWADISVARQTWGFRPRTDLSVSWVAQ